MRDNRLEVVKTHACPHADSSPAFIRGSQREITDVDNYRKQHWHVRGSRLATARIILSLPCNE